MKRFFLFFAFSAFALFATAQAPKTPTPSPLSTLNQGFSLSSIEVAYSRPSAKGRQIFGSLVPYNAAWRTGANAPTKVTFGEEVQIGKTAVGAGTYVLYTIPGEKEWKVIFNKGTSKWTANGFDSKDDVASITVPVTKLSKAVETFGITIENITNTNCDIVLSWERTQISIPVFADNDKRITESLEAAINRPQLPYYQTAQYYLENNKELDKAIVYVNKALEENPNAFWIYWLKARIYQKMGNKKEAIAAAQKSAELAAPTAYADEYKRYAESIKTEMK